MTHRLLVAAVQISADSDKEGNRNRISRLVRDAARQGASLIVLPEVFFWRGERASEALAAEPIPGPTTAWLGQLARELGVHLVGGSILERADDTARPFNTSIVVDPRGEVIARYRKIHLFDVDIAGHVTIRESDTRQPGEEAVVVETALGVIGLSVCYDLRFPELYRQLVRRGAEILCVPAAFTFATGSAHWEILLRARAIENQTYVIAPNQFGRSPGGVLDYGNSLIIDPWGTPLARAADGEGVIVAPVDPDHLARVRRELPCLQHARLTL